MISNTTEMPLDALVGELFGRATRRRGLVAAGWILALASHAAAALLFANHQAAAAVERTPACRRRRVRDSARAASARTRAAARGLRLRRRTSQPPRPPAAARAGALHTAAPDAAPAQQTEEAVDFTTDPNGKSYGGGVVAVGGTAALGAAGARVSPVAGIAAQAPPTPRGGDGLTPVSDLSRKPRAPRQRPVSRLLSWFRTRRHGRRRRHGHRRQVGARREHAAALGKSTRAGLRCRGTHVPGEPEFRAGPRPRWKRRGHRDSRESAVQSLSFEARDETANAILRPRGRSMADSPSSKANSVPPELAGLMAGEYRLGRKLGEGGFGAVYEAIHPLLKRRAAVKVLHRIAGSDSEAVLRFVAEARAVNQIRNRHIIDIFSFGKLPDGRHFYVMDLLEGEPLDRYIAREGRCSVETAVQLLRPIAEALDAAHAAGVVHRDLKPQNIYLIWDSTGETVPKLLDFGMAKLLGESPVHTVSGTPLGTPHYMSPEQARGDQVDGRSDVYALGVLCYELLTGTLPMTGDNTIGVLMAHIIQAPTPPSEVCAAVSAQLDAPILRMLEKKPEQRPASASEALAELSHAAERAGAVVPSGPPRLSPPPPTTDPERVHSHATADTTLQPFSPTSLGFGDPSMGRNGMARSASAGAPPKAFARWPLWVLLVAAGAGATVWFAGNSRAPAPATSAAAALIAVPTAAPAPIMDTPSASASSVPAAPSASDAAPAVAKATKRPATAASARPRIPRDLESPF